MKFQTKNKLKKVLLIAFIGSFLLTPTIKGNEAEENDDIVCTFFYGWWGNPNYNGAWWHWANGPSNLYPPKRWTSCYIPNYPNSINWNPSIQLYSSADPRVMRWQDKLMAKAGIDIAIYSWWGSIDAIPNQSFSKAIRVCKNVKWAIYYEPEGTGDPSPEKICSDIKWVLDENISSNNYAQIDGKWLVFVYAAKNSDSRWREAKAMLASEGYDVYLNADVYFAYLSSTSPWDAIHRYWPKENHFEIQTSSVDDSCWITPGFWHRGDLTPDLRRSLNAFKSAISRVSQTKRNHRFTLIETWNEYHEGTQIEPSQKIIYDPIEFYPSGEDYGFDFIDALGPTATFDLQWTTSGHRPVAPVLLEAEADIVLEEETKISEEGDKVLILEQGARVGSSIFIPENPDANGVTFTIRANATLESVGRQAIYPRIFVYFDDEVVGKWIIHGSIPQQGIKADDQDYLVTVFPEKGIHKVEVGFSQETTGQRWNLIVDYIDVQVSFGNDIPGPSPGFSSEGFESGNFDSLNWITYGDSEWYISSEEAYSGSHSARAGGISDGDESTLEVSLNCTSGEISFYYKVSSESGYDYLKFYVDDTLQDEWSGDELWQETSFSVREGTRTFKWEYSKDGSISRGEDTCWIDDIVFPIL